MTSSVVSIIQYDNKRDCIGRGANGWHYCSGLTLVNHPDRVVVLARNAYGASQSTQITIPHASIPDLIHELQRALVLK